MRSPECRRPSTARVARQPEASRIFKHLPRRAWDARRGTSDASQDKPCTLACQTKESLKMQPPLTNRSHSVCLFTAALVFGWLSSAAAQDRQPDAKSTFEIYGFAMLDIGIDFRQIDPNWFDTLRITRLPSFKDECGREDRPPSISRTLTVSSAHSAPPDRRTARSSIRTSFRIPSSTGVLPEWCSSGTCTRWMPIRGVCSLTLAVERPGASGDAG